MQIVPLYKSKELANLVRLCLAAYLLKAEQLRNARADEDVMASARPPQVEAERLDKSAQIRERDVVEIAASKPCEKSPRVHSSRVRITGFSRKSSLSDNPREHEHPTKPGKVTVAGKPNLDVPVGTH